VLIMLTTAFLLTASVVMVPAEEQAAVLPGSPEELARQLDDLAQQKKEVQEAYNKVRQQALEQYTARMKELSATETALAERILQTEKDLQSRAYLMAAGIMMPKRIAELAKAEPEQRVATVEALKQLLRAKAEQGLTAQDAMLARSAGQALEFSQQTELAADAYRAFAELFAENADAVSRQYASFFASTAKRLGLVGHEMELAGTTVAGQPFDWSSYRGKYVLVDFWATWCGPCVAEIPNLKRLYATYHERGFDIVGISLDRNTNALTTYLKQQEIPWVTLYEQDGGGVHPVAKQYGISAIPTMFFVDKEGKVLSLQARGAELRNLLEQHLGPVYASANPLAVAGQWEQVADEVTKSSDFGLVDHKTYLALATAQLMANNIDGYKETCARAFERMANSHPYDRTYLLLLCSLGPECDIDREKLGGLLEKDVQRVNATTVAVAAGMHELRCGRYEEALARLPSTGDNFQSPGCHFLRAIAHSQLGQKEQARQAHAQGIQEFTARVASPEGPAFAHYMPERWVTWGMLQILRREAEEAIKK
jgi:thiol-disulfide isomerase/thioredoxin